MLILFPKALEFGLVLNLPSCRFCKEGHKVVLAVLNVHGIKTLFKTVQSLVKPVKSLFNTVKILF